MVTPYVYRQWHLILHYEKRPQCEVKCAQAIAFPCCLFGCIEPEFRQGRCCQWRFQCCCCLQSCCCVMGKAKAYPGWRIQVAYPQMAIAGYSIKPTKGCCKMIGENEDGVVSGMATGAPKQCTVVPHHTVPTTSYCKIVVSPTTRLTTTACTFPLLRTDLQRLVDPLQHPPHAAHLVLQLTLLHLRVRLIWDKKIRFFFPPSYCYVWGKYPV